MTAIEEFSEPSEVSLSASIRYHLEYSQGVTGEEATPQQQYAAVALAVRDYSLGVMHQTKIEHRRNKSRKVCYLSMEFLIGRLLRNNLENLDLWRACEAAAAHEGIKLQDLLDEERDPGLGNGGLGRLAACFLDSMATLGLHGVGYGINYEYGLFRQQIVDNQQREAPDVWRPSGQFWQLNRQEEHHRIPVYGALKGSSDTAGDALLPQWVETQQVVGVPVDLAIVGYGGKHVNNLRLYSAHSTDAFNLQRFYDGDYVHAEQGAAETQAISKVLYPPDHTAKGRELRFLQEYFFVACALRDILSDLLRDGYQIHELSSQVVVQLNDTHPAIAIPELMRLLIVDYGFEWDDAWQLCEETFAYTNHTLLPEALEVWGVGLFERVLPLHLEIVYRINHQFLRSVQDSSAHEQLDLGVLSIVGEQGEKHIRMANLAFVTAKRVNGVARMHTELVKSRLAPEFNSLFPNKICNVTNGVTPRRWLKGCNPKLSNLISEAIGEDWVQNLSELSKLAQLDGDRNFKDQVFAIKQKNKIDFSNYLGKFNNRTLDPHGLYDVQIKRIHEYKRQLLNAFHIAHLYLSIVDGDFELDHPRTFLFSGKAAPSYDFAKLIIQFICALDQNIKDHPKASSQLSVVFLPDYSVSVAEQIIPAADVSEQISTAGYEASGTGNMKLAMNGALTIGTMDGANVEIAEYVGEENMFIFGRSADEIQQLTDSAYSSADSICVGGPLDRVLNEVAAGRFSAGSSSVFSPLVDAVRMHGDHYFIAADFDDYVQAQERLGSCYRDRDWWLTAVVRNLAGTGMFSSDRAVQDYCKNVWNIPIVSAGGV